VKIRELVKMLQEVEDQDKYLHLLGNATNGEDEDFDVIYNNIEVWNDADESITLFMSNITALDVNGDPVEQEELKKENWYYNNKR
tara:strand:+ start:111 stop:365 length:255 start_codon:yes stop_codon:yes gene_type:complete